MWSQFYKCQFVVGWLQCFCVCGKVVYYNGCTWQRNSICFMALNELEKGRDQTLTVFSGQVFSYPRPPTSPVLVCFLLCDKHS